MKISELAHYTDTTVLPVPSGDTIQRLNIAYAETVTCLVSGETFATFSEQERKYLDFLSKITSSEELNLVILNRQNLHRLIMGAKKKWVGRGKIKIMEFEFNEFKPHVFLSRDGRNYILSNHSFDNEKKEKAWMLHIAIKSTDIEDLIALAKNSSIEIRKTIARRVGLPNIVQEVLMHDSSKEVLQALSKNLSIGENATNHLLESGDIDIIYLVLLTSRFIQTDKLIEFGEKYCRDYNFLRVLLDRDDCPLKVLEYIHNFISEKISNPKALDHTEVKSILDICHKLGSHPSFPQEKRIELFKIKSEITVYVKWGGGVYGRYRPFNDTNYPEIGSIEDKDDIPF